MPHIILMKQLHLTNAVIFVPKNVPVQIVESIGLYFQTILQSVAIFACLLEGLKAVVVADVSINTTQKQELVHKLLEFQNKFACNLDGNKYVSCPKILMEFNRFHFQQVVNMQLSFIVRFKRCS